MLQMLTMRINVIMVSAWVDIVSVGHFAAATKVMEMGLMVPSLFGNLLMSRIAYSFNTQGNPRPPNYFAAWYKALFALLVPICVGVWSLCLADPGDLCSERASETRFGLFES